MQTNSHRFGRKPSRTIFHALFEARQGYKMINSYNIFPRSVNNNRGSETRRLSDTSLDVSMNILTVFAITSVWPIDLSCQANYARDKSQNHR